MFVPDISLCSVTNEDRDQKGRIGRVAARVQALQAGSDPNQISPSKRLARHGFTIASLSDGDILFGHGRRRDASFASPASHVSRDGAAGWRRDGRPPVGTVTHILHPSFEEKEVFFRPLSRASRPGTSIAVRNIQPDVLPFDGHTINHSLCAPTPPERADSLAELHAVKARLRSIAEESRGLGENTLRHMTMTDLGTMLNHAIDQHPQTSTSSTTESGSSELAELYVSSTLPDGLLQLGHDDSKAENMTMNSLEIKGSAPDLDSHQAKHVESALPCVEAPVPPNTPNVYPPDARKLAGSPFPRYNSRPPYRPQSSPTRVYDLEPEKAMQTVKPFSPVKQRAALYDNSLSDDFDGLDTQNRPPPRDNPRKADWSCCERPSLQKSFRAVRDARHCRHASLAHTTSPGLIPLRLPHLLRRSDSQQEVSSPKEQLSANSPNTQNQHLIRDNGPTLKSAIEKSRLVTSSGNESDSLMEKIDHTTSLLIPVERQSLHTAGQVLPTINPSNISLSNKEFDERKAFTLPHHSIDTWMTAASRANAEDELESRPATVSRASVVESKIKDLMIASKQDKNNLACLGRKPRSTSKGKVAVCAFKENVHSNEQMHVENLPFLQMPINEQAEVLREHSPLSTQTPPSKSQAQDRTNSQSRFKENIATSRRSAIFSPYSPLRGRSTKISPQGKPYAIEQRFSLSPSRSRSRYGASGVRVSVEVRNSPDKSKCNDSDHEIIVRASVEPDTIDGSSDG